MSFNKLKAKFDIPQKHFFKYLQLRSFILAQLKNLVWQPSLSTLETYVTKNCLGKKLVSQFYNMLVDYQNENSDSKRHEWIQDLGEDISFNEWSRICDEIQKFWNSMLKYISEITSCPIPSCPNLCILGIYPDNCSLSAKERKMVDLCLLQAKRLSNLTSSLALEKLTYTVRKWASEFYNIWRMFLELMKILKG